MPLMAKWNKGNPPFFHRDNVITSHGKLLDAPRVLRIEGAIISYRQLHKMAGN